MSVFFNGSEVLGDFHYCQTAPWMEAARMAGKPWQLSHKTFHHKGDRHQSHWKAFSSVIMDGAQQNHPTPPSAMLQN